MQLIYIYDSFDWSMFLRKYENIGIYYVFWWKKVLQIYRRKKIRITVKLTHSLDGVYFELMYKNMCT